MGNWTDTERAQIANANDFHVAPYREDGETPGTPTYIWSVVADGDVFIRAYNGTQSRWYRAARREQAGQVSVANMDRTVRFETIDDAGLNDRIDEAYRRKYADSQYLSSMVSDRTRAATMRVLPL